MVSSTASSVLLEDHKWFLVLDRRGHRKIASCYHWAVQWSTSTSVGRALWALLPRYYHGTVDDKPAEVIQTLHLQHHTSPTAPATGTGPSAQSILCLTYNLRLVYFGYPVVPLYNRPMLWSLTPTYNLLHNYKSNSSATCTHIRHISQQLHIGEYVLHHLEAAMHTHLCTWTWTINHELRCYSFDFT
jgi:hypothetical protein